jgi:hypothetical protein
MYGPWSKETKLDTFDSALPGRYFECKGRWGRDTVASLIKQEGAGNRKMRIRICIVERQLSQDGLTSLKP